MRSTGVLCVLLAGCGFQDMAAATSEVSQVVDGLFQSIDQGGWASTYETATAPELRQASAKPVYEQLGQAIRERLGKLTSKSGRGFNVQSMNGVVTAQAVYDAQFEKGTGTITATLRKSDGKWLLLNFHVNSPVFLETGTPCGKCGKSRPKDAAFCPACGEKVDAPAPK
jgi:hypothetical protein